MSIRGGRLPSLCSQSQTFLNCAEIVRKANARMEILRRVSSFGAPIEDLKDIYVLFVRSLLEQSAVVWHSSLTKENEQDLERVQKNAFRIILKHNYQTHTKSSSQTWHGNIE